MMAFRHVFGCGRSVASLIFIGVSGVLWIWTQPLIAQDGSTDSAVYAKYTPGGCVEAVERTVRFSQRASQDTNRLVVTPDFKLAHDTAHPRAVAVTRACGGRFDIDSVPIRDLIMLARLYIYMGDDSSSLRSVRRLMKEIRDSSVDHRVFIISRIINTYIHSTPARLQLAEQLLQEMDTITIKSAIKARVDLYGALGYYYWRVRDYTRLRESAQRVIAIGKYLTTQERQFLNYTIYASGYRMLAESEIEQSGDVEAALAILERAKGDVGPMLQNTIANDSTRYRMLGQPAQQVRADYWPTDVSDTIYPKRGRITILAFDMKRSGVPVANRLRRLMEDSLDVLVIRSTHGHFRGKVMSPSQEAAALNRAYISEFGFLGALAVTTTPVMRKPDGRIVRYPSPLNTVAAATVIVDQHGIVRYASGNPLTNDIESRLEEVLRSLKSK